jgi:ribosome-associated protein
VNNKFPRKGTKLNREKQPMAKKKTAPKKPSKKSSSKGTKTPKKITKPAPAKKISSKKTTAKTAKAKPTRPAGGASPVIKAKTPVAKKGPAELLADAAVEGILEVKGKNISVLNLKGIHNRVCDYFIICQADSNTQVNAIANSVEEIVRKRTGEKPYRSEGFENSEWILVDYVTVVVHIFQTHIRNFYNLESLWADAEVTEIAFD